MHATEPGRRIGPYTLVERLGRGAMGVVWRARDPDLDREVAIKMMSGGEDGAPIDDGFAQRFLLEARAAARIQSRHVVQVLQLGRTESGEIFIVMELLSGRSLQAMLRDGVLPAARAVRVARHIARGMAAAHALGVVHRDLKPANVMIVEIDGEETAKILDFGVAKLTHGADRGLTQSGALVGTIPYMAPEQILGDPVDARTDVYALGVVMFRMLTGVHLFEGDSMSDMMRHQVHTVAPRIRDRAPDVAVSGRVEDIVARCLQKDPRARFQSMTELEAALAAVVDSVPAVRASQPEDTVSTRDGLAPPEDITAAPTVTRASGPRSAKRRDAELAHAPTLTAVPAGQAATASLSSQETRLSPSRAGVPTADAPGPVSLDAPAVAASTRMWLLVAVGLVCVVLTGVVGVWALGSSAGGGDRPRRHVDAPVVTAPAQVGPPSLPPPDERASPAVGLAPPPAAAETALGPSPAPRPAEDASSNPPPRSAQDPASSAVVAVPAPRPEAQAGAGSPPEGERPRVAQPPRTGRAGKNRALPDPSDVPSSEGAGGFVRVRTKEGDR